MKRIVLALLLVPTLAFAQRTYWRATVAKLASGTFAHTHAELDSVLVVYTAAESDSDYHIRVRDPKDTVTSHFVVAECIPELPCPHPKVGQLVTVRGITRRDAEHGWYELHPVEKIGSPQ